MQTTFKLNSLFVLILHDMFSHLADALIQSNLIVLHYAFNY
jgi:hypothetical protein